MDLTRRRFLAGSLAACGAAATAGMLSADGWLAPTKAYAGIGPAGESKVAYDEERIACTYHQEHCGGMCPLRCTVRDGRLVKVEPNHCVDDRYETICLKGISEVQHIYGAGRVQTPLKRTGERGANEFVQVSWDEALDDIVAKIQEIQARAGKDAVMVTASSEANFPFLAAVLGAQTGGNTGIDVGTGNGLDPAIGFGGGYAMATGEARDWVNARMVLTVGSNFCESSLPQVRLFFEAKEAGAKMVVVDPHFSTTAGKADEWVPIEPGTDAALFLAMTSVVLDEGLADEEFMRLHTSLPYLVDDKGALVRDHAADPAAEQPETGDENPYLVIDSATGAVAAYNQAGVVPALSGAAEVKGAKCRTAYDLLVEGQKDCTPEWAAGVTGIPADKIVELARAYAEGPSTIALGWGGNDKISNADVAGHAAAVLAGVTGNVCKPGANIGVFVGGCWNGRSTTLGAWELPEGMESATDEMAAYDMRDKPNKVKAYICCGDFMAQHFANMSKTEDWARSLELIVSIDPYFTEGAKWADYVLPATTRFELDAPVGNAKVGYNQVVLQNKVIDPLFESKTDFWIQKEFARRLGVADALPKDSVEMVEAQISGAEDPEIASLTIDRINDEGNGAWPVPGIEEPRQEFADLVFATPSGRLDLYYENLAPYGQALPQWEAPNEAYQGNPKRAEYPLQLANVRTRFHIHNQFNDALWIQQYFEPTLDANPGDLEARGLATGDEVEVFNDRGSFAVRVHANPAIRSGSVRLCEGATADYLARGNMQSVTNDAQVDRGSELLCGPVIPFSDTLVEIKKA